MSEDDSNLDLDKLRELLADFNKLELSSSHNFTQLSWPIYKFHDNGWGSEKVDLFFYSSNAKNILNPLVQKLFDFLKTIVDPEMDDETVQISFYFNLKDILFDKFNENQIRRAVQNKDTSKPCDLNEHQLQDVIECQVELCVFRKQNINKVTLISTVCPIEMYDIDELIFFQTENLNLKIRKWNKTERAVFASQNAYNTALFSNHKSPMEIETFVEIEYTFSHNKYDVTIDKKLQEFLFELVDLIKWIIMAVGKNPYPIREGTCILKTCNPIINHTIQRDLNYCSMFDGHISIFIVKPDTVTEVRELIKDYCNTLNQFDDLNNALWFFGRACLDNLERDRLIDSVIGLEIILVQGHEQLGYQFRLHGATVFSTQWDASKISLFEGENELFWDKKELVKWFKKLYGRRSSSVHGTKNEYNEKDVLPALYALAVIIKGIIYLKKKGLLHEDDHEVSKAVGNYIVNKSVLKNVD